MSLDTNQTQQPTPETPKSGTNYWLLAVLVGLLVIIGLFFFRISQSKKEPSSILTEIQASHPVPAVVLPSDSANQEQTQATDKPTKKQEEKPKKEPSKNTGSASGSQTYGYKVKSGDTLFKIATRFNQSAADIKAENGMSSDEVQLDQELKIKIRAIHTVESGDGLLAIAQKYGVKADLIKKTNNLKGDQIGLGQELIIPLP
ncbi:LysM repeat-containing protein [Flexibacter flexilis DSM 6793]|uniref:LysM repeat-containing protein n=1 Tax=Flexibacter flexilis DSM 6793 TaxID=927664 RepID=A0A1I1KM02_9BACT|nr:LysM peptidoglycan-binding domain-containing protein [Flexibacter flexilis]SFC61605.1 LysM repeat-containing protein [Flexibacter flexilis DSM 6793]